MEELIMYWWDDKERVLSNEEIEAVRQATKNNSHVPMVQMGDGVTEVALRIEDVTEEKLPLVKDKKGLEAVTKVIKFISVHDFEVRDYYVTGIEEKYAFLDNKNEVLAQICYGKDHRVGLNLPREQDKYTLEKLDDVKGNVYQIKYEVRENKVANKR
jgi:hypothetical protein